MITYEKYQTDRTNYIATVENIPDKEIEIVAELFNIDITKALPQVVEVIYSAERTPFIRDNINKLTPKSLKKIKDYFKNMGWDIAISITGAPPDNENISCRIKFQKARKTLKS